MRLPELEGRRSGECRGEWASSRLTQNDYSETLEAVAKLSLIKITTESSDFAEGIRLLTFKQLAQHGTT